MDLPPPQLDRSLALADALAQRRTIREIRDTPLTPATISNLLWAACGVNRADGPFGLPGRTVASASNSQEIELYVALADGVYRYDAVPHRLQLVRAGDARFAALNPHQGPSRAPVQLVFVVDVDRLEHSRGFQEPGLHDPDVQKSYYFVDTGLIAANVYLFAAATGLACWFHNCDRDALHALLALGPAQRVLFAQSIGEPATPPAP